MLVVRHIIHIKDGCQEKLVEALKAHTKAPFPSPPHEWRIYTWGEASPWGILIWEQEFESMAEKDAYSQEFQGTPGARELIESTGGFVESRGSATEIWTVHHVR